MAVLRSGAQRQDAAFALSSKPSGEVVRIELHMSFMATLLRLILVSLALGACGKTIHAEIMFELRIGPQDTAELSQILERFAESEGFAVEDLGQDMAPRIDMTKYAFIRLKRGETMQIIVENFFQERFAISFYNLQSDPRFGETAAKLRDLLEQRWPGDVRPHTGS